MGNREIIAIQSSYTINENNTILLLKCHYQSPVFLISTVCDPVEFVEMMRQKYIVSNIWEEFWGENTQL